MTAAPGEVTRTPSVDQLHAALGRLRLGGAIFLRSQFTEAWAYESPPGDQTAAMLHPGASRVLIFHIVVAGKCWVSVGTGDPVWAAPGDVIVLPYGDLHRVGGVDEAAVCVPMTSLLVPPPWERLPFIRHGAGGAETTILCGYLHCDDPLFDPSMRVFPDVFVVQAPAGAAANWVQASIEYAMTQTLSSAPATGLVPTRIPEFLLVEVLRLHLASTPAAEGGWLLALRDPVLGPAMAALHRQPERKWTVADLALEAAVSRSLLDERFRVVLGRPPIRYLTEWRMHLAQDLLASTDLTLAAIARRIGYDSEEAFSRAFKRSFGAAPGTWRMR